MKYYQLKDIIKRAWAKLNNGEIDKELYEAMIDNLCGTYGTEYIAKIFVELTKAGEL